MTWQEIRAFNTALGAEREAAAKHAKARKGT